MSLCIEKALSQSGVAREDVNYINAHATSTPAGDLKEYNALLHCFGQNQEVTKYIPPKEISFYYSYIDYIIKFIMFAVESELYEIHDRSPFRSSWCCGSCCNCTGNAISLFMHI